MKRARRCTGFSVGEVARSHLLARSDEWDRDKYGMPISAAHVLLAGAAFSGRLKNSDW